MSGKQGPDGTISDFDKIWTRYIYSPIKETNTNKKKNRPLGPPGAAKFFMQYISQKDAFLRPFSPFLCNYLSFSFLIQSAKNYNQHNKPFLAL